jgi:hypothetical protein
MPPNPVTDKLANWQPDADTNDTNQPTNSTLMSDGQPGDLDGELRRIKSEVRGESINKSWERWLGMLSSSQPGSPIVFNYQSTAQFVTNEIPQRFNLYVGRRVKVIQGGGAFYGTVTGTAYVAPNTVVNVTMDAGVLLSNPITEVQFGPELTSTPEANLMLQNKCGINIAAGSLVVPSTAFDNAVALVPGAATRLPILIALDFLYIDEVGRFKSAGLVSVVNVNSACVRGRYLVSAAANNVNAQDTGSDSGQPMPYGTFAQSLSSTVAAGTVSALLFGKTHQP